MELTKKFHGLLFLIATSSSVTRASSCSLSSDCKHLGLGHQCLHGVCGCMEGYIYRNRTNNCIGTHGSNCVNDLQCGVPSLTACINSRCQCRPGYLYDTNSSLCLAKYGEDCSSTQSCAGPYNTCKQQGDNSSTCRCAEGYTYTRDKCRAQHNRECSKGVDCADTQSLCRDGKCECKDGYAYDTKSGACAGLLGVGCSNHMFCIRPYSQCLPNPLASVSRRCTCVDGYHVVNGHCQGRYGSRCDLNGLCSDRHTQCDVGSSDRCICKPYYKYDGSKCRPTYGGSCTAPSDCVDHYTTCRNSICTCDTGYVYNSGLKTCKAEHGSVCLSRVSCSTPQATCINNRCICMAGYRYHNGLCKGKLGSEEINFLIWGGEGVFTMHVHEELGYDVAEYGYDCATSFGCIDKYTECSTSNFTCLCRQGYVYTTNGNPPCRALIGESCSSDSECDDPASYCDTGRSATCLCTDRYIAHPHRRTCQAKIGVTCKLTIDCYSKNSGCTDGLCSCLEGYTVNNLTSQHCLAAHGTHCSMNSDCADTLSVCTDSRCVCPPRYVYDMSADQCRLSAGQGCSHLSICVSNSQCSQGVCACTTGYVSLGGLCKGKIGLPCNSTYQCAGTHVICADDKCSCDTAHHYDGTSCKVKLGNSCTDSADCYGEQSECTSATCQCVSEYEPSVHLNPKTCLASYGMACRSRLDCASGVCNAESRCGCASSQRYDKSSASCKALYGKRCYQPGDCYDLASSCENDVCVCATGYEYSEQQQACQDTDDCASTPCENGGSCVDRLGGYECICPQLFIGVRCHISTDYCLDAVCGNGGSCINKKTGYTCSCIRGFTGNNCHITSPVEMRDLVMIEISVRLQTSIDTDEFKEDIGQRLASAIEFAFCRKNNIKLECKPLIRRRRGSQYGIQRYKGWAVQVDRIERDYATDTDTVRILYSVRQNNTLQKPEVVVSLYSLLPPMELAIKLGYEVISRPSYVLTTPNSQHLCWLKSVFNSSHNQHTSHSRDSLQTRLTLAVRTALRIREMRLLNKYSTYSNYTSSNFSDTLVRVVDIRKFPSNGSIDVLYYAVQDNHCYSAAAISTMLNKLTHQEFTLITLESPIVLATPYNKTEQYSEEEYNFAFVIVIKMLPTVELDNLKVWASLEQRLTRMMVYVLNTTTLAQSSHNISKQSYSTDSVTCKLLKVERVNFSSSVCLVLYTKKQDVFVDPRHVVKLLKSVDESLLYIQLEEIIDVPLVAYVYNMYTNNTNGGARSTRTVNPRGYDAIIQPSQSTCESRNFYTNINRIQSMRYWVRTVTKVPLDTKVSDTMFVSSVEERLTFLFKDAFYRQSRIEQGSYAPLHGQRAKRSSMSKMDSSICAKVVHISRLNASTSLTEIIYYAVKERQPVRAISLVNLILSYDIQQLAVALSQVIYIKAEVYGQEQRQTYTKTTSGKEFVVVFMENYVERENDSNYPLLKVVLVTCEDKVSQVVLETPLSDSVRKEVTVHPNQATTVSLPSSLMLRGSQQAYKSLRVTSTSDIVVTAYNEEYTSQDGYTVLPLSSLGHVYHVVSFWPSSLHTQFAVVATQGNTRLIINFVKGRDITVTLNGRVYTGSMEINTRQYETLQLQSLQDLTGTRISSDKPVALYSGNVCTNIQGMSRDHLATQLVPEQYNGRSFVVIPYMSSHTTGTLIRILAIENDTTVYYPSKELDIHIKQAGHHHTFNWTVSDSLPREAGHFLFSNKPVIVAIFSYSGSANGKSNVGDPSMSLVLPMSAYQSIYRFNLPASGALKHYVRIAIENPEYEQLMLDGKQLPANIFWSPVPGTSPTIVTTTVQLSPGTHSLHHRNPYMTFLLHLYGSAVHESYSHNAGSCQKRFSSDSHSKSSVTTAYSVPHILTSSVRPDRAKATTFPTAASTTTTHKTTQSTRPTTSTTTTPTTITPTTSTPTTIKSTTITTTPAKTAKITTSTTSTTTTTPVNIRKGRSNTPNGPIKDNSTIVGRSTSPVSNSSTFKENLISKYDNEDNTTVSPSPNDTQTTIHPTLPRGLSTKEYWLAMTIVPDTVINDEMMERLETKLLDLFLDALALRTKRSLMNGLLVYRRSRRYAEERAFKLQVVACVQLKGRTCELIFYIAQNNQELDAETVVDIYGRLTTTHLTSSIGDVKVESPVRVYQNTTTRPDTITTDQGNFNLTGNLLEAADGVEEAIQDSTTSVTGWVVGAVAMACFLMGAACLTIKYWIDDKEELTWIQRRLSKQPQKSLPPVSSTEPHSNDKQHSPLPKRDNSSGDGVDNSVSISDETSSVSEQNRRKSSRKSSRKNSRRSANNRGNNDRKQSRKGGIKRDSLKESGNRKSSGRSMKRPSEGGSRKNSRRSSHRMSKRDIKEDSSFDSGGSGTRSYSTGGSSDMKDEYRESSRRSSRKYSSKHGSSDNSYNDSELPSSSVTSSRDLPAKGYRKGSSKITERKEAESRRYSKAQHLREKRQSKEEEANDIINIVQEIEDVESEPALDHSVDNTNSKFQVLSTMDKLRNKEKFRKRSGMGGPSGMRM